MEALCWKYARLGVGGKLFIVGPGTFDHKLGFLESFQTKWFNKINKEWGQNYSKMIETRTQLLQEGKIINILKEKFPNTDPTISILLQSTSVFGQYRGDLALFSLAGPGTPINDNLFNLDMLHGSIEFFRNEYPIQIEKKNIPYKGRWAADSPQICVTITRNR